MSTWQRVEQLLGSDNLKRLAEKKVGIIGLGSGGGFVALSLAMSGIGNFALIDDDALEEGNVVRHVADRRYIGQNKAKAVADLIKYRNPDAKVDVREGRIEAHMDILDDLDIVVVAVDGEQVKFIINEALLKRRITGVYAGVYEKGEGGDVIMIKPYDGPCYACWSQELRAGFQQPVPGADGALDYGMIGDEGTLEAEPGLWVHVTKVASIQTDLIINELLRGTDASEEMPANTIIVANSEIEILEGVVNEPHTGLWVDIQRDPDCLVCGDKIRLANEDQSTAVSLDDLGGDIGIVFAEDDEG
ncbi:MAG: ThiF family adenylyltransferase [Anaerolineae bacterium]|nr:ThiF family adenylyltransferase [Anaerolineae bacterium]MDQ7034805.1 ThiF family adenylyltransferase [Anaerolineae bacterium]